MDGFEQDQQTRKRKICRNRFATTAATWLSISVVCCLISGCGITRNVWTNLTADHRQLNCPCGGCSCGESVCTSCQKHSGESLHALPQPLADHDPMTYPEDTQAQQYFPPRGALRQQVNGSRPATPRQQPRSAAIPGTSPVWQPNPQRQLDPMQDATGFENQGWNGATLDQSAMMTNPPTYYPPADPAIDALREYRTQVQILSEQISLMKTAQDSMKASQETLQQSHEREMLELKLQQATADRDRLQRERELEMELEKQRRRELEAIDSLSQIIEGTGGPVEASGVGFTRTRDSTIRAAGKPAVPAAPAMRLPPVN